MANWQAFHLELPIKPPVEKIRSMLETLVVFLEVLKAILETIKALLILFGNPLLAIVKAIIAIVEELFNALKQTGVYMYWDVPDPLKDPGFNQMAGGFPAFTTRFKSSLFNTRNFNRPQPRPAYTKSGFVLICVDAPNIIKLYKALQTLYKFFGKEFTTPQYAAPANAKALPVGAKGDPILALAKVFDGDVKAIAVEWSLPTAIHNPDSGFLDMAGQVGAEFIPPKFLVEKTSISPFTNKIKDTDLNTAGTAGKVLVKTESNFEQRGQPGKRIKTEHPLLDQYGDPVIKFEEYISIDPSNATATFFLGQLGTFRYIDSNVEKEKTYFYRVRAYSGDLSIDANHHLTFPPVKFTPERQSAVMPWPADMGRPTGIMQARISKIPPFDVVGDLYALFLAGFSLNFHLTLEAGKHFNDNTGLPDNAETQDSDIGKGSLSQLAGAISYLVNVPVVGQFAQATTVASTEKFEADAVTGEHPKQPWQLFNVKFQSQRLTAIISSAMLENGSPALDGFRSQMQGPLTHVSSKASLAKYDTLEKLVLALTATTKDPVTGKTVVSLETATLYGDAYGDAPTRLNILQAVNFIKSFTGAGGDWIQIAILRDIIPWSGQFLYDILAKIQAILDAIKGIFDEIVAFINLMERKIAVLERFIQFLIDILSWIEDLALDFFILKVGPTDGGIPDWVNQIDNAGGTKPSSGPGGYSAGLCLAYVLANPAPLVKAFNLIF